MLWCFSSLYYFQPSPDKSMTRKLAFFVLIFSIPLTAISQDAYYETDTSLHIVNELVDGSEFTNSRFCRVKKKDSIIRFTPHEITEYGFEGGPVYVSKQVQMNDSIQRVFLEILKKGKINLYYIKTQNSRIFFTRKDSSQLVRLNWDPNTRKNADFHNQLINMTSDCPEFKKSIPFVNYTRSSLNKFVSLYNKCRYQPFPHFRYGLKAGYSGIHRQYHNLRDYYRNYQINIGPEGGFVFGLYLDQPILFSSFSLHSELIYSKYSFSSYKELENTEVDLLADIATIHLPVQLRYSLPFNTFRPFINAGVQLAYNLQNRNVLYESIYDNQTIKINKYNPYNSKYKIGYTMGAGIEYKLNHKTSLFFEIRYTRLYGPSEESTIHNSIFYLFTGINL